MPSCGLVGLALSSADDVHPINPICPVNMPATSSVMLQDGVGSVPANFGASRSLAAPNLVTSYRDVTEYLAARNSRMYSVAQNFGGSNSCVTDHANHADLEVLEVKIQITLWQYLKDW